MPEPTLFDESHREHFVRLFVCTFIATYAAKNYDECCEQCDHSKILEPPLEDITHMASELWKKVSVLKENKNGT